MGHTFDEKKGEGEFTFPDFLKICESPFFEDPIREEKLLECFREFDRDATGKISLLHLRYILQQLGEKLSDEEADAFIEWAQKVRRIPDAVPRAHLTCLRILRYAFTENAFAVLLASFLSEPQSRTKAKCCFMQIPLYITSHRPQKAARTLATFTSACTHIGHRVSEAQPRSL